MISREQFKADVMAWAQRVGVTPREVHVRPMKRKWGSCSSRGRLTFAADLLAQPEEKRAEVIVHELLHLKYPTHGKMFRRLLDAYLGQAETTWSVGCAAGPTQVEGRALNANGGGACGNGSRGD